MISRLKVNFSKTKLCGLNLNKSFLLVTSNFLHCNVDKMPFGFVRKRLSWWNGRHLSIGGSVNKFSIEYFTAIFLFLL